MVIATICTFFEAFNIPVFWPILVMYFIILFVITMKRQIRVSKMLIIFEPPHGKTNNVVSEQVRHKPGCTVTEVG